MALLAFWGHSDDRIMVDAVDADVPSQEFVAGNDAIAADLLVTAPDGDSLRVLAIYDEAGVWSFAVAQSDDGKPLPDWQVSIRRPDEHKHNDYTTELRIICPRGTVVAHRS